MQRRHMLINVIAPLLRDLRANRVATLIAAPPNPIPERVHYWSIAKN